jgi:hydrogenase expression/formation protein HypD
MKFLTEYRDHVVAKNLLKDIHKEATEPVTIMEICGGQTHSLVKNGILNLLPRTVTMVHGPGCPVCVTPVGLIDEAIRLSLRDEVILCSFGDMLRVPGSHHSLLYAKAQGATIRIIYSPLEAIKIAQRNPDKEVVFFAVGFETTVPAHALAVLQAKKLGLTNFFILSSHVLVPPAMEAILSDEDQHVQGFLAAGHVCTIMGTHQYRSIAENYQTPIVVTGFEPVDLLSGILSVIQMLKEGDASVSNQYKRAVNDDGNPKAVAMIEEVFEVCDQQWRGLGRIPNSGLKLKPAYHSFDAVPKFKSTIQQQEMDTGCIAGSVLKGLKKPHQCPHFGKSCTPMTPLGAPMVSAEGACAAYYQFSDQPLESHAS